MKKVLVAIGAAILMVAVAYLMLPSWGRPTLSYGVHPLATYHQPKTINITKCNIDIDLSIGLRQQKVSMLNKVLGLLLPSEAWATSCVATNNAAKVMLNALTAASTGGLNSGKLFLEDAGDNVLATLVLNSTLAAATTTNVLTFNAISDVTASGGAPTNCTKFVLGNASCTGTSTNSFFSGDVAASAATIIMSSVAITTGDTIHVTTVPTITLNLGT